MARRKSKGNICLHSSHLHLLLQHFTTCKLWNLKDKYLQSLVTSEFHLIFNNEILRNTIKFKQH